MTGGEELGSPEMILQNRPFAQSATYSQNVALFTQTLYKTTAFCNSIDILDIHVSDHGPLYSRKMVDASESAISSCSGHFIPIWVSESSYSSNTLVQSLPAYSAELGSSYNGAELGQSRFIYQTLSQLSQDPNVIGINWTFVIDPNVNQLQSHGNLHTSHDTGYSAGIYSSNLFKYYLPKSSLQGYEALTNQASPPSTQNPVFGSGWNVSRSSISTVNAISCWSASDCMAAGAPSAVAVTTDGGTTWSLDTPLANLGDITSLSCPTSNLCLAAGTSQQGDGQIFTTSNQGASWISPPQVQTNSINAITCPSSSFCLAVGDSYQGVSLEISTNSGASFSSITPPSNMLDALSASCSTSSNCVVVGDSTVSNGTCFYTQNAGASWRACNITGNLSFLISVSCPAGTNSCYAVGENAQTAQSF